MIILVVIAGVVILAMAYRGTITSKGNLKTYLNGDEHRRKLEKAGFLVFLGRVTKLELWADKLAACYNKGANDLF